jgi:ribosomal-protein-alanine N-acetyltransferase
MTAEVAPGALGELAGRPATADDLDELAALEAESFPDGAWTRRQLADGLTAPGALWWVGVVPGTSARLCGYAAFQRAADEAELLRVAVAPPARRLGFGTALVAAGLERLRAAGVRSCFLEVAENNRPALALYRRLGFEPAGRRPAYYPRGRDALLLRADFGASAGDRSGAGDRSSAAPPQPPSSGGVTSKPG